MTEVSLAFGGAGGGGRKEKDSLFLEGEKAASFGLRLHGRGKCVRPGRTSAARAFSRLVQYRYPFQHFWVVFGLEEEVNSAWRSVEQVLPLDNISRFRSAILDYNIKHC